jgi:CRISPR-associated protein Csm1
VEGSDKAEAQREYRALWNQFTESLKQIPPSHRNNLPLWLDHFESLWMCFTHAIPSATAGEVIPDVSLYDHSKSTSALAVALWRYHDERNDDAEAARQAMKARTDWDDKKIRICLPR